MANEVVKEGGGGLIGEELCAKVKMQEGIRRGGA